jgi:hypothetical protein
MWRRNASQFINSSPIGSSLSDRQSGLVLTDFFSREAGIAKAHGFAADLLFLQFMKNLVSPMAALKLRLLEKSVQTRDLSLSVHSPANQRFELDKMTICKAVEDRICKRIDIASRTDLPDQQLTEALRLLLKIVRRSGLTVDFSSAEILLLTRGASGRLSEGKTDQLERATIRF